MNTSVKPGDAADLAPATVVQSVPIVCSVIIVGYQSKQLIDDCLASIGELPAGFELLVIDNSQDGTDELVAIKYPWARVVPNDTNRGFGGGNNFAARSARGSYLLLLNPDTLVHPNALQNLMNFASETLCAACGGITVDAQGKIEPSCIMHMPSLSFQYGIALGLHTVLSRRAIPEQDEIMEVDLLSGAFMAVRRDVWDELGGFDESFFMYVEEVDLCKRIRDKGHKIYLLGNSRITHLVGSGNAISPKRILSRTRGQMHFANKHFGRFKRTMYFGGIWLHACTRAVVGAILTVFGVQRGKQLVRAFGAIAVKPTEWYGGWNGTDE
jgi:N-acetylglucosaminyl-diphospho-decaprenol L-rhamnosyltransferase